MQAPGLGCRPAFPGAGRHYPVSLGKAVPLPLLWGGGITWVRGGVGGWGTVLTGFLLFIFPLCSLGSWAVGDGYAGSGGGFDRLLFGQVVHRHGCLVGRCWHVVVGFFKGRGGVRVPRLTSLALPLRFGAHSSLLGVVSFQCSFPLFGWAFASFGGLGGGQ